MSKKLTGFAEACFDQNSVSELVEALATPADEATMEEWGIGPEEYYAAIEQALVAKFEYSDAVLAALVAEWTGQSEVVPRA